MSGWFRVARPQSRAPRVRSTGGRYYDRAQLDAHDHVVFEMSSGAAVIFNDPRRFGFMKVLTAGAAAADPALSGLGPEPLGRGFTAKVLAARLKGKKSATLKAALLDQRVVAGLGNIYVSEALHRAALSPARRASTLVTRAGSPTPPAHALVTAIQATLRDAITNRHRAGGADRFLVYDHEGRRCPRRGCPGTIVRRVQLGRSTFFCPVCQR
jgi:formamidopyrimidine-DNA glycosylase